MTEQRRLAAILVADVVGYSKLMGSDEAGTLAQLEALRTENIEPHIAKHAGRLFGDVVVQGDELMGDGVNVAARVEGIAEPGGVAITRAVHEQVRDKLDLGFVDKGAIELKNIRRPVQVFVMGGTKIDNQATASALPDKPSIAVLPFQNMSGEPEQEYFADGIVEDIITALSRNKGLFVIARNSSFTYRGKPVDVRQVGRNLGVRYVLEGSVRKAGNKVRLTGQLVEAATGTHVWADRFDGALDDIFDMQDRIASGVVVAMQPTLVQAEIERSRRKPTASLVAYDYYLRGRAQVAKYTREADDEAIALFRKAVELDPEWALPLAFAAECFKRRVEWGWSTDNPSDLAEAAKSARRAMGVDNSDPQALALAGSALMLTSPEEAANLLDRAIASDPNHFSAWNWRGWVALVLGENDAARYFESALRLSPAFPGRYWSAWWRSVVTLDPTSIRQSPALRAVARGQDGAGRQVVHRDALTAKLARQIPCPVELRCLGPGIDHHLRMWADLLHAADRHDATPAASTHGRNQGLQQFQRAAQVDRDLPVEPLARDGLVRLGQLDGGVQHQDIDRRPGRDRRGQTVPRIIQGKVLAERARRAAALLDLPHHVVGVGCFLGGAGMMDGQPGSGTGQGESDGAADFAAGPCYQSRSVGQAKTVEHIRQHELSRQTKASNPAERALSNSGRQVSESPKRGRGLSGKMATMSHHGNGGTNVSIERA
ncbi:hypothetical protein RSO01_33470 [Reyranella soli]|uniref:Guanylate cyclase domain-containing protein n=1 Tax=Reyranella soli TaxID=1230389 RepID=A0A512NB57_9HYPH|nr:tetratricopeptide repeat protein [Reyranella soli]GEP56181.1 hypothetical protein RSO01_33470 [Reyranella soli]